MKHSLALVLAVALWGAAWAQEKDSPSTPIQPLPAVTTVESSSQSSPDPENPHAAKDNALSPDTRPVTGATQFTLGSGGRQKYLLTRLHFRQMVDTNPGAVTGAGTELDSATQLSGDMALWWVGSTSQLAVAYAGGGTLYNSRSDLNQSFHQVSLEQQINWRRWGLLLADQASYLPESSFGFGGFSPFNRSGLGGLVNPGLNAGGTGFSSNLLPIFNPSQSILTGQARRVSNATVGELQYRLGPRSTLTASASYAFLRFLDPGFIDSDQVIFRGGYSRALTSRNSLGVAYNFTQFSFRGIEQRTQNHFIHLAYGRRVTGRMALQLTAGPRLRFRNVQSNSRTQVAFSMGGFLRYRRVRDGFSLHYHHGITGGSGVLAGADSQQVTAAYDRQLSRRWSGSVDFGFARNEALRETNLALASFQFRSWYAGASFRRPIGRRLNWSWIYRMQRQKTEDSLCVLGSCGRVSLRHQFGLTLDWDFRPIELN